MKPETQTEKEKTEMKKINGIIFYLIISSILWFAVSYLIDNKAFLTVEISNLKAYTFQVNKAIDDLTK